MKPSNQAHFLGADPLFAAFAKQKLRREIMLYPGDLRTHPDKNAELIRFVCSVKSRSELDTNEFAAQIFNDVIYQPFLEFKKC